jgi:protein-disulfide isomerase
MSKSDSDNDARPMTTVGLVAGGVIVVGIVLALILLVGPLGKPNAASPTQETGSAAPSGAGATQWAAVLRTPLEGGAEADLSWLKTGVTDEGRPWIGAEHPTLELDEFVDFQCPRCCEACPFLQRLFTRFPDKVRIYIRHLPHSPEGVPEAADSQSRSCQLARAAICAGRQGRYWEAHDYLFHHRDQLASKNTCVSTLCRQLGLDEEAFRRCLSDPSVQAVLARDVDDARKLGIRATPTFVAGGKPYRGGIPDEVVDALWQGKTR